MRSEDMADLVAYVEAMAKGLKAQSPYFWQGENATEISYPDGAHHEYAEVEGYSFWFLHRNKCIAAVMRRYPACGPLLDIGGGNGFVSQGLRHLGHQAIVLEPGRQGAEAAHRKGLPVINADIAGAGIVPETVAAAGMFDVLEHIGDDAGMLRLVTNALRPGGRLYLTVPAFQWLWSEEDAIAGHFRRYSATSLRKRVEAAGLELEYISAFFSPLVLPLLLLRSIPSGWGRLSRKRRNIGAEHRLPENVLGRTLDRALHRELSRIEAGRSLRAGTSLVAVARKLRATGTAHKQASRGA